MALAFPPTEITEFTDPMEDVDEKLTSDELQSFELFSSLKRIPDFDRFPGTTILRRGYPGRVVCTQGRSGATAYYILTTEDALKLRTAQLQTIEHMLEQRAAGIEPEKPHLYFRNVNSEELKILQERFQAEVEQLRARAAKLAAAGEDERREKQCVAKAHLIANTDETRPRVGLFRRFLGLFSRPDEQQPHPGPSSIPIDAPTDIDAKTRQAPLHEGEVFGEMSCINRAPRSATVIIEQDCYLLEMLRNVLDKLQTDPGFRRRMDESYTRRVKQGHVRRLSVFRNLTDEEYERISDTIELQMVEAGQVIFEERDPADAIYVIRSGLVKVVKNAGCTLHAEDMTPANWKALSSELAMLNAGRDDAETSRVKALAAPQLAELSKLAEGPDRETKLLAALNDFIRNANLPQDKAFPKDKKAVESDVGDRQLSPLLAAFPDDPKNWSQLECWTFQRTMLELLLPMGIPRRLAIHGPTRILAYLGRGDVLGEMGVVLNSPRSATCVAYDHPEGRYQKIPDSRGGTTPSRVELLRIPRASFEEVLKTSSRLRMQVEEVIRAREHRSKKRREAESGRRAPSGVASTEFEELGLIQGQRLMLIDLDRCTRCGACVDACIATHDDGRNRLFLDGPRYEKYLVPITCRSCLDPVCMIGCPVGAINRGDNGEIRIASHCIGCKLCVDQCPYGSIQLNEAKIELSEDQKKLIALSMTVKEVRQQAVVCDLCSSRPGRDPACVYSCPHDAAFRVNAQEFFYA